MASKRKIILYMAGILLALISILFLYRYRAKVRRIVSPFLFAVLICYIVNPLVIRLERKKIRKPRAILLVYLFIVAAVASIILFIIPQLINNTRELMDTVPEIVSEYQTILNGFMSSIRYSSWPDDVKSIVSGEVKKGLDLAQKFITDALKKSLSGFVVTITVIFDFALAMVIAYYFIKDADFFKSNTLLLMPRKWRNGMIKAGRDIHGILSNFIQGQLLIALIVGILETIGLFALRAKYPLILGLIGGLANIIPFFGPIIGAVPAVAVALLDSPVKAFWVVGVFCLIQQIDNNYISPKIIEGRLGLHPVSTILAVLIGGEFFGLAGMMLAVPIFAMLKALIKSALEAIV